MGNKIPFDLAAALAGVPPNSSIFNDRNPYGYKINVNHPDIRPLYEHYKLKLGAKILTDAQRLHFESIVFQMMARRRGDADG